jgi:hypothetical protein
MDWSNTMANHQYKRIQTLNATRDGYDYVVAQIRLDGLVRRVAFGLDEEDNVDPTQTHDDLVTWFLEGNTFDANLTELTGTANPVGTEQADVGWLFHNTNTNDLFICTYKLNGVCIWKLIMNVTPEPIPTPLTNRELRELMYQKELDGLQRQIIGYQFEYDLETDPQLRARALVNINTLKAQFLSIRREIRQEYPIQQQ